MTGNVFTESRVLGPVSFYCQFVGCPNRGHSFVLSQMSIYEDFKFCSRDCVEGFLKQNPPEKKSDKAKKHLL